MPGGRYNAGPDYVVSVAWPPLVTVRTHSLVQSVRANNYTLVITLADTTSGIEYRLSKRKGKG